MLAMLAGLGCATAGCATAGRTNAAGDAAPDSPPPPPPATTDAGVDAPPTTPAGWVFGYYAGYDDEALPVASIDWGSLTHLVVAFYPPDGSDGIDETLQLGPGQGPALTAQLVAAAHAHGVKAIASIGGSTQHDALLAAASDAHRAAFVTAIAAFITGNGFDGIDLDWEPIHSSDALDRCARCSATCARGSPASRSRCRSSRST